MRIAWFTPLSSGTGVARFSANVVEALSGIVDVEVWAEPRDDNLVLAGCKVNDLRDPLEAAKASDAFDLRVFNMGNNHCYHQGVYRTYGVSGGLSILHDKRMQNFFSGAVSPADYMRLMAYLYGDDGVSGAAKMLSDPSCLAEGDFLDRFPLIETCLWNAEGVVTHSVHSCEAIRSRYGSLLPVEVLQLPLCVEYKETQKLLTRDELGIAAEACLVVATGRIGRGKRIETVIEALAASERLRRECVFVAVGDAEADYLLELRAQVRELQMSEQVEFVTQADDLMLQSYLAAADICVNLRYPSTESSSASLVEQMYHGKPTIVYDIGVYAEQPDDLVFKVPFERGTDGVQDALVALVSDASLRGTMGGLARRHAEAHCLPPIYARHFLDFAVRVMANRSTIAAVDASAKGLRSARSLRQLRVMAREAAENLATAFRDGQQT